MRNGWNDFTVVAMLMAILEFQSRWHDDNGLDIPIYILGGSLESSECLKTRNPLETLIVREWLVFLSS